MKKNYWKIASIILICLSISLIVLTMIYNPVYDLNGFKIKQSDYNAVVKTISVGQVTKLCNMNIGKCIIVGRLK